MNYDEDNAYPQRIEDIVNSSGTATACVRMKSRFLVGGGFADKTFYKAKVNKKGLTADQLLRKVGDNMSKIPYVAIHINYNALYQKVGNSYIPFAYVRLTDSEDKTHPNMVAIYDDWDRTKCAKVKREKVDFINFYNPDPAVIQAEVEKAGGWANYKGQVYLWTPKGHEYPLADFDSVLEDMQTDSKSKTFKFRNITTNFMASHIAVVDKFEDEGDREDFHESIEVFQGADDALKIMVVEKPTDSSTFELQKVEIQDVEHLYEYTEESVRDNIILNFLIPPVLLIRTEGKLGTSTEIKDATAYYNGITADERLVIEEIFKEVFSNFATNINPSGDYSIIPFKAPVSAKEISDTAAKNIQEIIANTTLTRNQKISQLKILYGIPEEDAVELVGEEAPKV